MANHTITMTVSSDGQTRSVCSCRSASPFCQNRWEADDWSRSHLELVERVKANLTRGSHSLKLDRDYFRSQAENEANTEKDRALWKMLADEVTLRLNDSPTDKDPGPTLW